jgi:hypothetical protein
LEATKTRNKVVLEFEIDENGRPSKTGKTKVHYTTGGFDYASLKGYGINLNVISK